MKIVEKCNGWNCKSLYDKEIRLGETSLDITVILQKLWNNIRFYGLYLIYDVNVKKVRYYKED